METGPYELVAPIGSGGFAQVFQGLRKDTGDLVAIKVQRDGPIARERFLCEIDVLCRLDHPHVMPILEADPDGRWYAMPLATQTLRELHDRNPLDWESLREALSSICGALLHMHAHDLVHRDASPNNILQLPNGHWVLADYGLVRRPPGADIITTTGMQFGTPRFSAPEVHHDPRSASPAADAYSLGAIASWFTMIHPDRNVSSDAGRYWAVLIQETVFFDPSQRWSVSEVAHHVAQPLPATESRVLVPAMASLDPCLRCGAIGGLNAAGRCCYCGFQDEP